MFYDNKPYVYLGIHRRTRQFYIGYREANKFPAKYDLGINYKTSSNTVNKIGFENFEWSILQEFYQNDRTQAGREAYDLEQMLIKASIRNPLCLNRHYCGEDGLKFRNVGPMSESSKANITAFLNSDIGREVQRLRRLGKKSSTETRDRISKSKSKTLKQFEITSPEGIIYRGTNLRNFCSDHSLNMGAMSNVLQGKTKKHKGWTGKYC